jgi:AcrR family transcriptional regulator
VTTRADNPAMTEAAPRAARARSRTNAEHSQQTRRILLKVARREFATHGYASAATERIVARAKLTRGALYHHYRDKRDLFRAVFAEIQQEILSEINAQASEPRDPLAGLVAGCDAFLDMCLRADIRQIVLIDAPAVLGWDEWRRIDARYSMGSLREGLDACMSAGALRSSSVEALTYLLSGAMNEAVLWLAQSEDPTRDRRRIGRVLRELIEGLRP